MNDDPFAKIMESEGISFPEAVERLAKEEFERLPHARKATPGNNKILEALLFAEEFIAQELENREAGGESDYVREARDVLAIVREALK